MMLEIRNPDGYLIAKYAAISGTKITGALEIKEKNWLTRIEFDLNGELNITHSKA